MKTSKQRSSAVIWFFGGSAPEAIPIPGAAAAAGLCIASSNRDSRLGCSACCGDAQRGPAARQDQGGLLHEVNVIRILARRRRYQFQVPLLLPTFVLQASIEIWSRLRYEACHGDARRGPATRRHDGRAGNSRSMPSFRVMREARSTQIAVAR